jgi:hypothetical protein
LNHKSGGKFRLHVGMIAPICDSELTAILSFVYKALAGLEKAAMQAGPKQPERQRAWLCNQTALLTSRLCESLKPERPGFQYQIVGAVWHINRNALRHRQYA